MKALNGDSELLGFGPALGSTLAAGRVSGLRLKPYLDAGAVYTPPTFMLYPALIATAGRAAAKQRGVRFGRPRKLNTTQEKLARRLLIEGKNAKEIALTFKVHRTTIYRLSALEA